jgi:hypothetical protein
LTAIAPTIIAPTTITLVFALLPALMTASNLLLFRTPAKPDQRFSLSVIIPARNEAANIDAACRSVLDSTDVDIELIVVDDHSTDATPAILAAISDPRLTVAQPPALPAGWIGKPHACLTGARLARHALMLFLDADVRLTPDALSRIGTFIRRRPIALASGFPRELTGGFGDGLLLPLIHVLLLGFLPIALMRRSTAPAFGAGCGQMIIVERDAYWAIGGHAAIRHSMHDGITLARAFRAAGMMTDIFDASRLGCCRMYTGRAALIEGLLKNATEGIAKPVALPIWTALLGLGQILPMLLLPFVPAWPIRAAAALGIATRLVLAARFRAPWWSALLNPLGVATFLALQWVALIRQRRGRKMTWRGRAYAP